MKAKYIFLLLLLANINVLWASNTKVDGIWYDFDKSTKVATVTYRGKDYSAYAGEYKGNIIIPEFVKYRGTEYCVTGIAESAFFDCTELTSITIPGCIANIERQAFYNCTGLTSVTIGEGVKKIGKSAFNQCTSLRSIKIPNTITNIGDYAFYGCTSLTSVTIPNRVTSIGRYAFHYCIDLTTVTIYDGVKDIGESAFNHCTALKTVTIPNSVTSIGDYAFYDCTGLTSVSLPNNLNKINSHAFHRCINLVSITIPNSVMSIENYAFSDCKSLTSITISNGVTSIGNSAFSNCESLISITIPNSVVRLGDFAFHNCKGITSVIIGDDLKSIGESTFSKCENLKSVSIGKSVQTIGKNAFGGCRKLASIELPNSVTTIGDYAFDDCASLTSITLPNGIKSIGNKAFNRCVNLREVYYPNGVNISNAGILSSVKKIAYNPQENQNNNSSKSASSNPPLLVLKDKTQSFVDANSNNQIDADEKCTITFKVENKGKGSAKNCEARVRVSGTTKGISVQTVKLPTIAAGQNYEVSIPISSNIETRNGNVTFSIEVYEPNGWGVAPFDMTVVTKAYEPPYLQVVDYNIASNSGKIRKMEPFTVMFNLQNTKYGDAEDVKVNVKLPANVFVMDGDAELSYPLIKSGEVKPVQIVLAANNNYYNNNIPITIEIKEKHGKFAENKQLDIALNQTTSSSINIAAKEEEMQERKEIQVAMIKSDVDRNIPVTNNKNPNTFVLIIANEHYQQVAAVPYALNDGNVFKEYCLKTLGVSEKHVHYIPDATINHIKAQVNWLANITETWDDPQVIVYYAGHGIPDEASKSAYLLPVDGSGTDVTTGYKLDELYATLGNMPASRITVFMDACFSGSKREEGMLASARGVALKAKSGVPQGKMVVFSAAQGDETAYPYREQQHGMFTYHLLKKLQETSGDVTLQELGNYIIREVKKRSLEENDKKQTPCVIPSSEVGTDWENWKLK